MDLNFSLEKMKFPVNILRILDKRSAFDIFFFKNHYAA